MRFGVCMSLNGDFAGFGNSYMAGIRIRLDDINSRAAETGLGLEMLVRDDQSDPRRAAAIVEELAAEGVVAVIDEYGDAPEMRAFLDVLDVSNDTAFPICAHC